MGGRQNGTGHRAQKKMRGRGGEWLRTWSIEYWILGHSIVKQWSFNGHSIVIQ